MKKIILCPWTQLVNGCHIPQRQLVYCTKGIKILKHSKNRTFLKQFADNPNILYACMSSKENDQAENMAWELLVDYEGLTSMEKKIHERHRDAVEVRTPGIFSIYLYGIMGCIILVTSVKS